MKLDVVKCLHSVWSLDFRSESRENIYIILVIMQSLQNSKVYRKIPKNNVFY